MKFDSNANEVAKKLEEMARAVNTKKMKDAVTRACYLLHGDVVKKTPVNTGRLRNSVAVKIEVKKNKVIGIVGTNVRYAPFVEFGTGVYAENGQGRKTPWLYYADEGKYHGFYRTRGQKPKKMFTSSFEKDKAKIERIISEAMNNLW